MKRYALKLLLEIEIELAEGQLEEFLEVVEESVPSALRAQADYLEVEEL